MSWRNKAPWLPGALAFCVAAWPLAHAADSEDELKAAAVWLFVQYAHLHPGMDGTIVVGVAARPSFVSVLRHTLQGKTTGGHPVRVVEANSDLRCCQVLYLSGSRFEEIRRGVESAQAVHALTIGESDRFLEQGGAVNLFIADGHITFEASLEALDRCGVSVSSNLLKFGQIRRRGKGRGAK